MNPTYQFLKKHGEFEIFIKTSGFEPIPIALGKVISYLVRKDNGDTLALFAFAYAGLESLKSENFNEQELLTKAIDVISKYIDENKIENKEFTFEYSNGNFTEVHTPRWWVNTSPSPSAPSNEDD